MKNKVGKRPFLIHLDIRCFGCSLDCLSDRKKIKRFTSRIVKICNLHVVKGVILGDKNKGFSCFTILRESHVAIVTYPKCSFVHINLLSCVAFKIKALLELISNYLSANKIEAHGFIPSEKGKSKRFNWKMAKSRK